MYIVNAILYIQVIICDTCTVFAVTTHKINYFHISYINK